MKGSIVDRIRAAVDAGLPTGRRSLLAVSGGVDSMVLLDAARSVRAPSHLAVATFDHAAGEHSAASVELVQRVAMAGEIQVVTGRMQPLDRPSEAAWRDARIAFLRAAAEEHRAALCTAHTRDDQVETVLFRELRGTGTRGLAALAAEGSARRPLLGFGRADVMDYAEAAGVEWVDDPTNFDRAYARNRLRHDVLPALRAVRPEIDDELADVGARAATWRADLDAAIDARLRFHADREHEMLDVARDSLSGYPDDALGIIWPALLARIGVAADWRGTRRLVAFTIRGRSGQRIQLSGGWTVFRTRRAFEVRRTLPGDP